MSIGGKTPTRSVYRDRRLRVILAAEFISSLGSRMSGLAIPWFVLITTGSATKMGFVFAVELIPMVALGIPSSIVVHRLGVRRTMLICDGACAVLVALVPALHHAGLLSYWLLLLIVLALGSFITPYLTCQRLLIPDAFGADETLQTKANALLTGTTQVTGLVGPSLAGVLIALIGAPNLLWIDAASFALSFLILAAGLPRLPNNADDEQPHGALAGMRFVLRDPLVRRIATVSLMCGAFFPILIASLPVVAEDRYGGNPRIAGLLLAAWSAGSLAGILGVLRLAGKLPPTRLAALGALAVAAPLWLLMLPLTWWQFALVLVASSMFLALLNSPMLTLFMTRTPDAIRPQALAFLITANMLAGPAGFALAGPALESWGVTPVEGIVAAGMTAALLLLLTIPRLDQRSVPAPA